MVPWAKGSSGPVGPETGELGAAAGVGAAASGTAPGGFATLSGVVVRGAFCAFTGSCSRADATAAASAVRPSQLKVFDIFFRFRPQGYKGAELYTTEHAALLFKLYPPMNRFPRAQF